MNSSAQMAILDAIKGWYDYVESYIPDSEFWYSWLFIIVKISAILVVGRIAVRIINRAIHHAISVREASPFKFNRRRTKTIGRLLSNIVSYVMNFIIMLMVLDQLGIPLAPLLAGAGVVGLAIGFGAQSLVKDVITGFFIIFEDQFAVGDTIQTGSFNGTVEEIGLRVTKIRSWTGEIHIIPNGSINQVTNFSIYNSIGVVDVAVPKQSPINQATEVIEKAVRHLYDRHDDIVREPKVLGVQAVTAGDVVIRVTVECKPNTQQAVVRQMNAYIKEALEAANL